MTELLSPAAQAVLSAFGKYPLHGDHIAENLMHGALPAALRAAADQVVPEPDDIDKGSLSLAAIRYRCKVRDQLLAIAAELEAGND